MMGVDADDERVFAETVRRGVGGFVLVVLDRRSRPGLQLSSGASDN